MKTPLPKAVTLGLTLMAIVVIWWSFRPKQPVYQGESLAKWLRDLDYRSKRGEAAKAAIRAIGSSAVPALSAYLKRHDDDFDRRFNAFVQRHGIGILLVEDDSIWHHRAAQAFAELGLVAESALPALAEAATNSQAPEQFVEALSSMLPKSISIMTNLAVTSPSRLARQRAVDALSIACRYPEASAISILALKEALRDQDQQIREHAIGTLAKLCDGNYSAQVRESARQALKSAESTERVMLPLTKVKGWSTLVKFIFPTNNSAPWPAGNCLTFEVNPTELEGRPAGMADVAHWLVFNIHAENFYEITKRLKLTSIEAEIIHKRLVRQTVRSGQGPETVQMEDVGDCIITDGRIPRDWFLSTPGACCSKSDWGKYLAIYPEKFNLANREQK